MVCPANFFTLVSLIPKPLTGQLEPQWVVVFFVGLATSSLVIIFDVFSLA